MSRQRSAHGSVYRWELPSAENDGHRRNRGARRGRRHRSHPSSENAEEKRHEEKEQQKEQPADKTPTTSDPLSLRMLYALEHEKNTDVVFEFPALDDDEISLDSTTFRAHKAVLSTGSEVFDKMFNGDYVESTSDEPVVIRDISRDAFVLLVRFIYAGELGDFKIPTQLLMETLVAAQKYMVQRLQEVCRTNMRRIFGAHSVPASPDEHEMLDILESCARSASARTLLGDSLNRLNVAIRISDISEQPGFQTLPASIINIIIDSHKKQTESSARMLWEALVPWLERHKGEKEEVNAIIEKIDFHVMSQLFFAQHVVESGFIDAKKSTEVFLVMSQGMSSSKCSTLILFPEGHASWTDEFSENQTMGEVQHAIVRSIARECSNRNPSAAHSHSRSTVVYLSLQLRALIRLYDPGYVFTAQAQDQAYTGHESLSKQMERLVSLPCDMRNLPFGALQFAGRPMIQVSVGCPDTNWEYSRGRREYRPRNRGRRGFHAHADLDFMYHDRDVPYHDRHYNERRADRRDERRDRDRDRDVLDYEGMERRQRRRDRDRDRGNRMQVFLADAAEERRHHRHASHRSDRRDRDRRSRSRSRSRRRRRSHAARSLPLSPVRAAAEEIFEDRPAQRDRENGEAWVLESSSPSEPHVARQASEANALEVHVHVEEYESVSQEGREDQDDNEEESGEVSASSSSGIRMDENVERERAEQNSDAEEKEREPRNSIRVRPASVRDFATEESLDDALIYGWESPPPPRSRPRSRTPPRRRESRSPRPERSISPRIASRERRNRSPRIREHGRHGERGNENLFANQRRISASMRHVRVGDLVDVECDESEIHDHDAYAERLYHHYGGHERGYYGRNHPGVIQKINYDTEKVAIHFLNVQKTMDADVEVTRLSTYSNRGRGNSLHNQSRVFDSCTTNKIEELYEF